MKRTLYIAGLLLSLIVFGAFALIAAWGGITHGHLNGKGILFLIGDPIVCLAVLGELRRQIRRQG